MKRKKAPAEIPFMVYATKEGNIIEHNRLRMTQRCGEDILSVNPEDLIPLPEGSELFILPDRYPLGYDINHNKIETINKIKGKETFAVAAFISPAHTQTGIAGFIPKQDDLKPLPLFAYTAVGWINDRFWVTAFRSDKDKRQDFKGFDLKKVKKNTVEALKIYPENRLIQHLGKCSLQYGCPAAKNFFLKRYEAPLPTSPQCNARCLGCISNQDDIDSPPISQERIKFVPSPEEISEIALLHLTNVNKAVVSFGQGCEGEPILQADTLEKSIRLMRKNTPKGTINLNSNASLPEKLNNMIDSGLDSMRISLNSSREEFYTKYYRPKGYAFSDVLRSWDIMKTAGRFVSLNLFVFPGITDDEEELNVISGFIEKFGLDLIQIRNHNIDPLWYMKKIAYKKPEKTLGVKNFVRILKERFPALRFGYFNPPLRD